MVWIPLQVVRHDGTASVQQVVVGLAPEVPERVPDDAVIGAVDGPSGPAMAYAALADSVLALDLCRMVAPQIPMHRVELQAGEQSNTSLIVDGQWIVKLYRRLEDGPNPDVEVTEALGRVGFDAAPVPVAVWRRGGADLAVMRHLYRGSAEGATLASRSLSEVLVERRTPRSGRHDVARSFEDLGATVARLHLAMAEAFGVRPLSADALVEGLLSEVADALPAGVSLNRVEQAYRRLEGADDLGSAIRIHGDLHLGQVLSTRHGWVVIDFEGEPTRPLDVRRRPASPLRDVAGMLRSFHYSAEMALEDHGGLEARRDPELALLAQSWEQRATVAFVSGYTSVEAVHRLLPADRLSRDALLSVFELQKAVYEVAYEAAHRPALMSIPVRGVHRLLDEPPRRRW